MQIAACIPFHMQECPVCQHYVKAGDRCRAFKDDSAPRPLLAVFAGETNETCERFQRILAPLSPIQPFETAPGTKICPAYTAKIDLAEKTCPHCGTWFKITVMGYCAKCQTVVQASDNRWCCRCGNELADWYMESKLIEQAASSKSSFKKNRYEVRSPQSQPPAQVRCHRCNSQHSPGMTHCPQCGAKLRPAKGAFTRLSYFISDMIDGLL